MAQFLALYLIREMKNYSSVEIFVLDPVIYNWVKETRSTRDAKRIDAVNQVESNGWLNLGK